MECEGWSGEGLVNSEEIFQSRGSGVDTIRGTGIGSRKWEALMTPWAEIPGAGEPERGDSDHLKPRAGAVLGNDKVSRRLGVVS